MPVNEPPLRLLYDNAVIGAGLSGLVAAMRLSGSTILLSRGLGSTAISSGVISPSVTTDGDAEAWLLDTMKDTACPYVRGTAKTDLGFTRSGLIPVIAAFEGEPYCLSEGSLRGLSCQEAAKQAEVSEAALDGVIKALSSVKAESVLIPPVLGVTMAGERRAYLEKTLGKRVYEYVTAPSVHGLRLISALKEKASHKKGLTLMDIVNVERLGDGKLYGHMGTKRKRPIEVEAGRVIIATGGLFTGFTIKAGRVIEPLTGVEVSASLERDVNASFFTDHPVMYKGIGNGRVDIPGFKDVRAIGATAEGYGLYRCLAAGYHAGGPI